MAFSFYALIYFLPISIALIETFLGIAQVTYFIKRGVIFLWKLKDDPENTASIWQKIKAFVIAFLPHSTFLSKPIGIFLLVNVEK